MLLKKMAEDKKKEPVFKDLQAEDPDAMPTEIESMCMNCGENGETKLLLTKIPHYREVIIMSFNCDLCGYQNNEIQSGGQVQDQGIKFKVKIQSSEDLCRQIVKSDYATLTVPEIELEIPPNSQKGAISTVEGMLQRTISGLTQDQPVRRHMDPEGAKQIDEYVEKIENLLTVKEAFHIIVVDPSGNSFVENPHAPRSDPHRDVSQFLRTREQDHALGLYTEAEVEAAEAGENLKKKFPGNSIPEEAAETESCAEVSSTTSSTLLLRCQEGEVTSEEREFEDGQKIDGEATGMLVALPRVLSASTATTAEAIEASTKHTDCAKAANASNEQQEDSERSQNLQDEVLNFPTNCPECGAPADTKMKLTNIPHFKEVVIMATVCEYCGHKTNEVKSGGGIESKGKRITLHITDPSDLSRDVLKSETCSLSIPDLEFEMGGYALGGRFTTLEGLLENVMEQVENNPLLGATSATGDSAVQIRKEKIQQFKKDLQFLMKCDKNFTLILDDPAGNSYIQNIYAPDPDPELIIQLYDRTFEQNEDLGLNDMKTENYLEDEETALQQQEGSIS